MAARSTRFDWLYLEVAGLRGSMTEVYLGAEYRLFKPWNTIFMYRALYF